MNIQEAYTNYTLPRTPKDLLSLESVQNEIYRLSRALESAIEEMGNAGLDYANAENEYRAAKATARFQALKDNPKATIPVQDALIDQICGDSRLKAYIARAKKDAASEKIKSRRAQLSAMQSLNASLKAEMDMGRF